MSTAYGISLAPVTYFKYLGRVFLEAYDNWPGVVRNLRKECKKQEGFGCPDLGPDLLCSGPVGPVVRVGDVSDDPQNWEGVGRITPQGGLQADKEATLSREGRLVGIPLFRRKQWRMRDYRR